MRLTTKGRFAVTAMLDLALRESGGPVTLAGISERQGISLPTWNNYSANCAAPNWWTAYAAPAAAIPWPKRQ